MFIWPSAQDLPARVAVTGGVAAPHLIWVGELEFPAVACPADEGLARLVGQQLQEKLPQLDRAAACRTEEEGEEKRFLKGGGDSAEAFRWVKPGGMGGKGEIKRQIREKSVTLPDSKTLNIYSLNYSLVSAEGTM